MSRFSPYVGIAAALLVGFFSVVLYQGVIYLSSPALVPLVTSTLIEPSPTSSTTVSVAPKKLTSSTTPPSSPKKVSFDAAAVTLMKALVNIICYAPPQSGVHSISASGVVIDPKGIILTNAHVAQYFLLADRNVSCTIRTGNPATDAYEAALIYISPYWITANAEELTAADPSGTGQYDFAFLAVTKSATANSLPSPFPYAPLATKPPQPYSPVVIASYGAQSLPSSRIQADLHPTLVLSSVKEVFTFGVDSIDVLSFGGSAAAQEGSSGGGIANALGNLVATITTSTIDGDTSTRSLHAITASYIRSEYAAETGQSLDTLLSEPPTAASAAFVPRIPALESFLTAHLP